MWCNVIYIVLKKCYFLTHTMFYRYVSSNVNEGIRAVLNHFSFFFLWEDFTCTKSIKIHISEQKQKRQHFNALKKHLRRKKVIYSLICVFMLFMLFFVLFTFYALFVVFALFVLCSFCAFYAFCACEIFL